LAHGAVVGVEIAGCADHGVHFQEFGGEFGGNFGIFDEGEVPVHGHACAQALDFPAGDGDGADDGGGYVVYGLVDAEEPFDEAGVVLALLVAEDGGVRGDE
jgi:hypothetical protein